MTKLLIIISLFITSTCFAATHETRWSPDTCGGCVVVYSTDDATPTADPVLVRIENKDSFYSNLSDQDMFTQILTKNREKNKAINAIATTFSIDPKDVTFSYDTNRNLHVTSLKLTSTQKIQAQSVVDSTIGTSEAVVA